MGNVIDITSKQPHLSGTAICVACEHQWEAVAPVGVFDELECPECGLVKGVLKYGVVPEPVWMCNCGCWLFVNSGKTGDWMCWQCGNVPVIEVD